jgi:hypothetical protein
MGAGVAQGIGATDDTKQGDLLALHLDQFGLLVCSSSVVATLINWAIDLFSSMISFGGISAAGCSSHYPDRLLAQVDPPPGTSIRLIPLKVNRSSTR